MKRKNRFLALALAMVLALSLLPGCGGSEEEPETTTKNEAQPGGSITWPEEGLDTSATLASTIVGDTLYMVFNGVQARTSGYFTPRATPSPSPAAPPPPARPALPTA